MCVSSCPSACTTPQGDLDFKDVGAASAKVEVDQVVRPTRKLSTQLQLRPALGTTKLTIKETLACPFVAGGSLIPCGLPGGPVSPRNATWDAVVTEQPGPCADTHACPLAFIFQLCGCPCQAPPCTQIASAGTLARRQATASVRH